MQSTKRWKEITTEEALLLSDLGVDVFCQMYTDDLDSRMNIGELARWAETSQRWFIRHRGDSSTWYIPDDDD